MPLHISDRLSKIYEPTFTVRHKAHWYDKYDNNANVPHNIKNIQHWWQCRQWQRDELYNGTEGHTCHHPEQKKHWQTISIYLGGGPREVVSTAAFHARVRGSVPGLGGLKETKLFLPHPRVKVSIVGSLRDREVACSVSDRQGSNFESCVWRTVSSQSFHHPQEVLLAQFGLYVHKGGLNAFILSQSIYWI